jgi:HD superfamily phosphohydrolase
MPRPKFFRDPVHVQIRYAPVAIEENCPGDDRAISWAVRRLIDTTEVQRLRHIRQNGLTNLVFHGAEHSRFAHSLGVAHLAGKMCRRVARNMGQPLPPGIELATSIAGLLHDVGHGPFSHTIEEILEEAGAKFDHEVMTRRFLEEDTEINRILRSVDTALPLQIVTYIDKKRKGANWWHKIVSSQLDADRLDYLLRDSRSAGLQGGFDLPRLIDSLEQLDEQRLAVEKRSLETVEAYLIMLDQMYRVVYYHHATRAGSALLSATLRRAFDLRKGGDTSIFPNLPGGETHPLALLADQGDKIDLGQYVRLGEHHVWALIECWQHVSDRVLSDLSRRLMGRNLFKTVEVDASAVKKLERLRAFASDATAKTLPHVDSTTVGYYVTVDEPSRTSYKLYDWRTTAPDESIWIVSGQSAEPIEKLDNQIIGALRNKKYFHRMIFPPEIRESLLNEIAR